MKILILGGAGYLSNHLIDLLQDDGHQVSVYDLLIYTGVFLKDVDFIYGDVRDSNKLKPLLGKYDCVINCCALVGDPCCKEAPETARQINQDFVEWLSLNYNGKIISISTASVYGKNHHTLNEDSPTNPLSIYAITKLKSEQFILNQNNGKNNNLIFRLGTLAGVCSKPSKYNGFDFSRYRNDLVANIWSASAAKNEDLIVYGKDQFRPMLNVNSVGSAISYSIRNDISGIFNLVDRNLKLGDLAELIVKISNSSSKIIYSNIAFTDMRDYSTDASKFEALGWQNPYTLEGAILSIIKVVREKRILDLEHNSYSNANSMKILGNF